MINGNFYLTLHTQKRQIWRTQAQNITKVNIPSANNGPEAGATDSTYLFILSFVGSAIRFLRSELDLIDVNE